MASARLVLRGAASASPTELQSLQDVAMGLLLSSGLGEDAAGLLVFSATEAALQDLSHAGRSSSPFHLAPHVAWRFVAVANRSSVGVRW